MADLEQELTKEMLDFLDRLVSTGKYRDRGEVLRDILREIMQSVEKSKLKEKRATARTPPPKRRDTGGRVIIQLKTLNDL